MRNKNNVKTMNRESESSLSFNERMRRELQRIHTGSVNQCSCETFHNHTYVPQMPNKTSSISIDKNIEVSQ